MSSEFLDIRHGESFGAWQFCVPIKLLVWVCSDGITINLFRMMKNLEY